MTVLILSPHVELRLPDEKLGILHAPWQRSGHDHVPRRGFHTELICGGLCASTSFQGFEDGSLDMALIAVSAGLVSSSRV